MNNNKSFIEDNKKILKLIEDTIQKYKRQYKNKLDILYKNPAVKALKSFKNFLLLNKDTKIINGYKLNEQSEEIRDKYKIINKNIKNYYPNLIKQNKMHSKIIELYKLRKFFSLNKNKNSENEENNQYTQIPKNNIIVGPDKLNNLCKSKDFTIGRILEMNFGLSEEDKKIRINKIKRLGNSAFRTKNNSINIKNKRIKLFSGHKQNNKNIDNSMKSDEEQLIRNSSKVAITYKDTLETLSNNNSDININNSNNYKTLDQKIADNDLSFISELSETEKKNGKKKKYRIKSVKEQKIFTEREKKLLIGFQKKKEVEVKKSDKKIKDFKLKNVLECYKNDINLLKITNPKAYELQKIEEENDYMLMKKKIELMKLFEKNKIKNNKRIDNKNE